MKTEKIRELVYNSLKNSKFKWRTARGISKETKIPLPQVVEFLERSELIRRAKKGNREGEPLYTLEELYEKDRTLIEKVVSVIINKE